MAERFQILGGWGRNQMGEVAYRKVRFHHAFPGCSGGASERSPDQRRKRQRIKFSGKTHEGRKIRLKRHLKPAKTSPPVKISLARVSASIVSCPSLDKASNCSSVQALFF